MFDMKSRIVIISDEYLIPVRMNLSNCIYAYVEFRVSHWEINFSFLSEYSYLKAKWLVPFTLGYRDHMLCVF